MEVCELHAFATSLLGKETHITHCIGGWMDPKVKLDIWEKRKISCLCQESIPDHPAHSSVTILTVIPAEKITQWN